MYYVGYTNYVINQIPEEGPRIYTVQGVWMLKVKTSILTISVLEWGYFNKLKAVLYFGNIFQWARPAKQTLNIVQEDSIKLAYIT